MTATSDSAAIPASRRDNAALALLGGMFIALAIVGSASLGVIGPSVLQDVASAIGIGRSSAIETEQRRQAATLDALGQMIRGVSAEVSSLNGRVKLAEQSDIAVSDRFTLVDVEIASLLAEVRNLRSVGGESEPWHDPIARIDGSVTDAERNILNLRSSLDDQTNAYRKEMGGLTKRLDRLEQLVTRDLTGSIRSEVRKQVHQVRPVPRRVKVRTANTARPAGATPTRSTSGGIVDRTQIGPVGTPQ